MPKMKSHPSATRRLRRTGSGKIVHKRAYVRHILEKKSSKRKRRLAPTAGVSKADARRARRLLGG
jgi:large subunit ribosomal protein L35